MKLALFAIFALTLSSPSAKACMGGQYPVQLPDGTQCLLLPESVYCNGKVVNPSEIQDFARRLTYKNETVEEWGRLRITRNIHTGPAANPIGLKLLIEAVKNIGDENFVAFRIYEIYRNGQRVIIKVDSNRAANGAAMRGLSAKENVLGFDVDDSRGC